MDISVAFKFLIIFILAIILISLTRGLHFLMKDDDQSTKMAKSLTIRIVLSVLLFILIFVGWSMGWISPKHI
jgi:cytochrome bd-type quinol oxidase subunit 2